MNHIPMLEDIDLFYQGASYESYKIFGAHLVTEQGTEGVRFTVWAPKAKEVSVVGDFNHWNGSKHRTEKIEESGVWTLFIEGIGEGEVYKYEILSKSGERQLKSDPYAVYSQIRPATSSIIYSLKNYKWNDQKWQQRKNKKHIADRPLNIYELHFGSWKKKNQVGAYTYKELASPLIDYVLELGYTHIEIMPLMEHPYDGSWGYESTGYFSLTSRYGTPYDFMYFVDYCHQNNIGVILDWVPSHFCQDEHGLTLFDGTEVFEYQDKKLKINRWGSLNFEVGKGGVKSYLISNAIFWMELYHIDGLRVDAVFNIIKKGRNENVEGTAFLRKLNDTVHRYFPHALMIAEESGSWPQVTDPTHVGGLGFDFKWNMGWMNDILMYMQTEFIHRKMKHDLLTFSLMYSFSEKYILALSHDEVVHEKKSLWNKMSGNYWEKFAGLRLLFGFLITHPGKKLLFMGGEFGQWGEWQEHKELKWALLGYDMHAKMHHYVKELNHLYRKQPALWEIDHQQEGFEWISVDNREQSVIVFMRKSKKKEEFLIIICNFTAQYYDRYRIGIPYLGTYREVLNSDQEEYGGLGNVNNRWMKAEDKPWDNQPYRITIKLPSLGISFIKRRKKRGETL